MNRLIQAAYFSDACRSEAEALGIAGATDANAMFMAFIGIRERAGAAPKADAQRDDCREPLILLINLLRLNGVDAELVFASNERKGVAAMDGAPSGMTDRVFVYVSSLDRYFDPASPLSEQTVLNRTIAERATRTHILGPTLAGDGCRSTCMNVYFPRSESSVRVRTEAIRGH